MPTQYPQLNVADDQRRVFTSWISVEDIDKQGELLPLEQLGRVLPILMSRGGVLMDSHTNRHIGKMLNYELQTHPSGHKGYLGTFQMYNDYSVDNERWNQVKKGEFTGISVGGRTSAKPMVMGNGDVVKVLDNFELYELSLVPAPANQHATITSVNYVAKEDAPVTNATPGAYQPSFSHEEKIEMCLKAGANDPFAICTAAVGREDNDKYERCVLQLKERLGTEKACVSETKTETKTKGDSSMATEQIKETKKEEPAPQAPAEVKPQEEAKPAQDDAAFTEKIVSLLMQGIEKQDRILELLSAKPQAPEMESEMVEAGKSAAPKVEETKKSAEEKPAEVVKESKEVAKLEGIVSTTPRPPVVESNPMTVNEPVNYLDLAQGKKQLHEYN